MVNIFNISSDKSFLDTLAKSLLKETDYNPEVLQEYLILLPTRRACTSFKEILLNQSKGKALILPQIQPIGDSLDEEDLFWYSNLLEEKAENLDNIEVKRVPISRMKRLFILSNLVMKKARLQNIKMSVHTSFIFSIELANLFDELLIE